MLWGCKESKSPKVWKVTFLFMSFSKIQNKRVKWVITQNVQVNWMKTNSFRALQKLNYWVKNTLKKPPLFYQFSAVCVYPGNHFEIWIFEIWNHQTLSLDLNNWLEAILKRGWMEWKLKNFRSIINHRISVKKHWKNDFFLTCFLADFTQKTTLKLEFFGIWIHQTLSLDRP